MRAWNGMPLQAWAAALLLGLPLPLGLALPVQAAAGPVLQVGVLEGSPPCSEQLASGQWLGRAVTLWQTVATREQLPYVLRGYPSAQSLLDATRQGQVDVGVGCLTVSPERLGRYRFSLPFQESGLAVMVRTHPLTAGQSLLRAVLNPQLLRVMGLYLLVIALLSWVVWRDEHRGEAGASRRDQLRRYALVFQVLASGPGTNVIVSRLRGHGVVLLSWMVRIIGASLIVSTITLDVVRQSPLIGFQPRSLIDLVGRRIAVRPGSVSALRLEQPPLRGKVVIVPLPRLDLAPALLLGGEADAVLADELQLRWVRQRAPARQRARLQLVMEGVQKESQAFALSPRLNEELAMDIDRAISQAKREGLIN